MDATRLAETRFARTVNAVAVRSSSKLESASAKLPYLERLHRVGAALVLAKDYAFMHGATPANCISFLTMNKGISLSIPERTIVERFVSQIQEHTREFERFRGKQSSVVMEELLKPAILYSIPAHFVSVEVSGPIVGLVLPFLGILSPEETTRLLVFGGRLLGISVGYDELKDPMLIRRVFYINMEAGDESNADSIEHERNHLLFDLFPLGLHAQQAGTVSIIERMQALNYMMTKTGTSFKKRLMMQVEFGRHCALSEVRVRLKEMIDSAKHDFDPESLSYYKPTGDIDNYCRRNGVDPNNDPDARNLINSELVAFYRMLGTVNLMVNAIGVASTLQIVSLLDYNEFEAVRKVIS